MTGPRLSEEEINRLWNEYQTQKRGASSFASESTAQRGSVSAPRAESPLALLRDTGRAAAQGATFGFADEAEAGVRSLLPDGMGGGNYKTLRDAIRATNEQFNTNHPIASLAANIAGGLATGGGAMAAAKGTGRVAGLARMLAPEVSATTTTGQRVLQGARVGAAFGGLAGAGGANEMADVPKAVVVNAIGGGVLGGGLTAAAPVVNGTRNLLSRIGQGQNAPSAIRRMIRADSPEQGATKRLLGMLGNQKMSVDDLAAASARADVPDVVGEVIGARGIRGIRNARALGYDAPDMIEQGLTTRARDDVQRVRQTVAQELGPQIDDEALKLQKLQEARAASGPLYEQALDGVTIEDPRIVSLLERPVIRSAYEKARNLAANDGDALPDVGSIMRGAARTAEDVMPRRGVLPEIGLPRNLAALSDDDLNTAMARMAQARDADLAESQLLDPSLVERVNEAGNTGAGMSEDLISAIEDAGYTLEDWQAAQGTMARARFRLRQREQAMQRLSQEAERRGLEPQRTPADLSLPGAAEAPELPRLTGRQLQYVKLALNDAITKAEGKLGGTSTTKYAQLVRAKNEIDDLLYEFSNPAPDGSSLWGQANAAYAGPMREAEAFRTGVKTGRNVQAPDVPRLLAGPQSEWTARGIANTLQDDLARMGDGTVGPLRDPAPALMGSSAARARLEAAAEGDLGRINRIEDAASNASRRLRTRQTVLGGSQTAEKLADQAEAGLDPSAVLNAVRSPTGGLLNALGQGAQALQRNVVGQDMDALARMLMAGGPQQMSRQELIALLREALPQLEAAQRRGLLIRGQVANQTGQRVQP